MGHLLVISFVVPVGKGRKGDGECEHVQGRVRRRGKSAWWKVQDKAVGQGGVGCVRSEEDGGDLLALLVLFGW